MNGDEIELRTIQGIMIMLGAVAVGIGAMGFLQGVQFIHLTEQIFNLATGQSVPLEPATISPTIDNEFRFYATFWFSYGLLVLWVAKNILTQYRLAPLLATIFFVGGIGRGLSHLIVGAPHPVFVLLMVAELVIPGVLVLLYRRILGHIRN